MKKMRNRDIVVTKTVSLRLSILNAVMDEQEVMGVGFSAAVSRLLLLSLNMRKDYQENLLEEGTDGAK